jgi:MFS family permease
MSQRRDWRNVAVLATCQMLYNSGRSLLVATSPLIAYEIADNKALSTVPITLAIVGTAAATIPAAMLMRRIGRGYGFATGSLIGVLGGLACLYGLYTQEFLTFCAGALLFGFFSGFAHLYRFAAADVAAPAFKSKAISLVLTGGLVAAFVGPEMAKLGQFMFDGIEFFASYMFMTGVTVLSGIVVMAVDIPKLSPEEAKAPGRPIREIMRQPVFIVATLCAVVAQAVMNLLMTSTPLAMLHAQHIFADTALVIEWHIFFMYAPGFFTGSLINRFGAVTMICIGIAIQTVSVAVALSGTEVFDFWLAMALLGLGWNYAFTAGTNLLTEVYTPSERAKTQAANNFIIFTVVAGGSLSSGSLMHYLGWDWVNIGAMPLLFISFLAALWLAYRRRGGGTPVTA